LDSKHVQVELSEHLGRIRSLLSMPSLCGLTVGLLANMIFAENSVVELSTLLEMGFQEAVAEQLVSYNLKPGDALYGTALEILDSLVEEDVEMKILNPSSSTSAFNCLVRSLLMELPDSIRNSLTDQVIEILLRWAGSGELRAGLVKQERNPMRTETNGDSCHAMACVYQHTLERHKAELETSDGQISDVQQLLTRFESTLGEVATQIALEGTDMGSNKLFDLATEWIKPRKRCPVGDRLCATGYLVLCNMCTDDFAVTAVREFKLQEPAIRTLRDPEYCQIRAIRTNASAFLANLCQPKANRASILASNIVRDTFYDNQYIETTIPLRMARKLVSKTDEDWVKDVVSDVRAAKLGIPCFKDMVEKLPNQQDLQKELNTLAANGDVQGSQFQPGQSLDQQLTRDIGHIYVDIRRRTASVNQYITTELIWCLVNLILLGMRSRNALDISDGVFGLGLALQNDTEVVEQLALEATEALRRGNGFPVLRQVIAMGEGNVSEVAKKVAENATKVLDVLITVAKRKSVSEDVVAEMEEVFAFGVKVKMGS
jgi:hypothetical protein